MRPFYLHRILLLLLVSSCSSKEQEIHEMPPVDVTSFTVESNNIPAVFTFVGFAESSHPVEIRARVEGYLDQIAYQEGALVQEGDLLFQLDPKQYAAKVEASKGEVARQEALLENAKLTVNRLAPLYEQKAASKKDLDNAIAAQLAYQATLQSAQAQLLDAEINLGYTTIISPITGYADRSRYRQGALINPGANSLLTTVSRLDPIWVYFTISDNDLLKAKQQEEKNLLKFPENPDNVSLSKENNMYNVEAILSDESKYPYQGKVDFSAPTYNQATGTLLVRAVFPNKKGELRPGQFIRVKVYGVERPAALLVPQRAFLQKKNGLFVYLIDPDNHVVAQDVSVGDWYGDYQIVTNGLRPGDKIVVDGINKIFPGDTVNVLGPWHPPDKKD